MAKRNERKWRFAFIATGTPELCTWTGNDRRHYLWLVPKFGARANFKTSAPSLPYIFWQFAEDRGTNIVARSLQPLPYLGCDLRPHTPAFLPVALSPEVKRRLDSGT